MLAATVWPFSDLALVLRFRRARAGHRNPPRPETRKKLQTNHKIPPKNPKKITEKPSMGDLVILEEILIFFRISGLGGCPVRAKRNRNLS